jgi:hypothetical protein
MGGSTHDGGGGGVNCQQIFWRDGTQYVFDTTALLISIDLQRSREISNLLISQKRDLSDPNPNSKIIESVTRHLSHPEHNYAPQQL